MESPQLAAATAITCASTLVQRRISRSSLGAEGLGWCWKSGYDVDLWCKHVQRNGYSHTADCSTYCVCVCSYTKKSYKDHKRHIVSVYVFIYPVPMPYEYDVKFGSEIAGAQAE